MPEKKENAAAEKKIEKTIVRKAARKTAKAVKTEKKPAAKKKRKKKGDVLTEEEFLFLNDTVETLGDITDGYYPTVKELKKDRVDKDPKRFLHILLYFSTDPFSRLGTSQAEDKDYKELVSFSKRLLYTIDIA